MSRVIYRHDQKPTVDQFIDLLNRSTLGERRPVNDRTRIASMLDHANLVCTAWDGDVLVGIARSLTDFAFCCYLSDLAVDASWQRQGIGVELLKLTQQQLHPQANVILLAAPKAEAYYPKIGMVQHRSAWLTPATPLLSRSVATKCSSERDVAG